jgi:hypothetical protein
MPREVGIERADMARRVLVHTCAERERAQAEGGTTTRAAREDTATDLIDAITGLWLAPSRPTVTREST